MKNQINMEDHVTFMIDGSEILVLKSDGFYYKDQRIDDGGEAHRLFIQCMEFMHETVCKKQLF